MAEIRESFFIECEELLEALQDGLAALENGDADTETVNVCFRAVHSIKGGAGAFGLDRMVRFAHSFETVLDAMRSGSLTADAAVVSLMFRAADMLSDVVRASRDETDVDETTMAQIVDELDLAAGDVVEEIEPADFAPAPLSLMDFDDDAPADTGPTTWIIQFKPHASLFTSGNEPLHLIRTLGTLGPIAAKTELADLPPLEDLDTESSALAWTVHLTSDVNREAIEEIFEFVSGLCDLDIQEGRDEHAVDTTGEADHTDSQAPGARLTLSLPIPDDGPTEDPSEPAPKEPASKEAPKSEAKPDSSKVKNEARGASTQPAVKSTVRVDLERIDRLVNLVGELVINQAMLSQSVSQAGHPSNSAVSQGLDEFMQLTRDIQDSVMMIRAQPVKSLFQRMSRIVREASASVGKSVRMVTDGESTEVDKTVIERLADPLTHMIRNAVDHGLENSETRLQNGKTKDGTITLSAAHRSGRVIIEIKDDGAGINRSKVREIAVKKGLIPEDAQLSDSEIDGLIFLPGFSTASQVTDLSGRGVGMDVVRNAIQELGGRISIESNPGLGSKFVISLPLTLAVLDGMVVRSSGETLVMPLGAIQETLSLEDTEMRHLGPETNVIHVRDSFVPLLDLAAELGFREPLDSYDGHVVLLIAQENGSRAALIVDSIEEQRQVVIKGLQDSYGQVPGIAAATILGDGQVALILDPIDLMSNATGRTRRNAFHAMVG